MRLLDLFCGAGGATRGYQLAGWHVTGVDIEPQPNYIGDGFIQTDAIDFLDHLLTWPREAARYDAIHASPPCQASTNLTKGTNAYRAPRYQQLIPQVRARLNALDVPTVIENVQGSDLRRDLILCGEMFSLDVIRHRYFELNGWECDPPIHLPHRGRVAGWRHGSYYDGPYVAVYGNGGGKGSIPEWQAAMGIDWTDVRKEIAEAIPPAYTQYIGERLYATCSRASDLAS